MNVVGTWQRWFLYPPERQPPFDPDATTLSWFFGVYPRLGRAERPLECVLDAGQLIYFPDRWWHATLNARTTVFTARMEIPGRRFAAGSDAAQ